MGDFIQYEYSLDKGSFFIGISVWAVSPISSDTEIKLIQGTKNFMVAIISILGLHLLYMVL